MEEGGRKEEEVMVLDLEVLIQNQLQGTKLQTAVVHICDSWSDCKSSTNVTHGGQCTAFSVLDKLVLMLTNPSNVLGHLSFHSAFPTPSVSVRAKLIDSFLL